LSSSNSNYYFEKETLISIQLTAAGSQKEEHFQIWENENETNQRAISDILFI